MNLSIRAKLFLTLLLACVLVLFGTQAFVRWSFQRGLVELIDARERDRIEDIANRLVEIYTKDQSWEPLAQNPPLWVTTLIGRGGPRRPRPPDSPSPDRLPHWVRRTPGEAGTWPPPQVLDSIRDPNRPTPLELRLMLLDGAGRIVYGRPELLADTSRFPLLADGKQIGALALIPGQPVVEMAEIHFRARQGNQLWVIALAMLLLSAALAYPLSRRLVRPVRRLQDTARQLAAGNFEARVRTGGGDEIARLGRDINALAGALERNEQARRRWVADISHELRTPIALLRAELEALQDGVRRMDRSSVDALHGDVLRLGRLVDDLYELSTTDIGALGYRFEETDLAAVLSADIDAFRTRFAEADLEFIMRLDPPGPHILTADAQRLSQLFRNLIGNSLQYTDPGGCLTITLSRRQGLLAIDFQDTAPGVPTEDLSRLFERLYRVDASRSRHTGGAGLGLAIAKNVVEAHGGNITASPAPEGGLWIRVELPL